MNSAWEPLIGHLGFKKPQTSAPQLELLPLAHLTSNPSFGLQILPKTVHGYAGLGNLNKTVFSNPL